MSKKIRASPSDTNHLARLFNHGVPGSIPGGPTNKIGGFSRSSVGRDDPVGPIWDRSLRVAACSLHRLRQAFRIRIQIALSRFQVGVPQQHLDVATVQTAIGVTTPALVPVMPRPA